MAFVTVTMATIPLPSATGQVACCYGLINGRPGEKSAGEGNRPATSLPVHNTATNGQLQMADLGHSQILRKSPVRTNCLWNVCFIP